MKETRFRAWDKENNTMLTWEQLKSEADFSWFADENLVFMQYTGLVDKHGVRIFDGDIVKNVRNGISRKVYWDTHCASFHLSKRGREEPGVEYWSLSNPKWNYEVIGNIYETPELLATKKD